MLNFFFTSNVFSVSPAIQAINDVLFPLFLFGLIFMSLCAIFLNTPSIDNEENVTLEHNINNQCEETPVELIEDADDSIVLEQQLTSMVAVMEQYSQTQETRADLFDVEQECSKLRALGARLLKAYCKEHKLKGYSSAANAGVKALAKFMLVQQVKACDVEGFRSKIVA